MISGLKALRGGAWNDDAVRARSAYIDLDHLDNDWNVYGFRLLLKESRQ